MNAIAKASTFVLLVATSVPVLALAAGILGGCDKFKKGGDADAGAVAPVTPAVVAPGSATPVDTTTPSATALNAHPTTNWRPAVHPDGGVVKLADGGTVLVPTTIPTIPPGAAMPSGLAIPTALPAGFPSGMPTTLPSNFPKTLPTALPTATATK